METHAPLGHFNVRSTTACTIAIFASAVARSGASAMIRMIGSVLLGRAWTQAVGQSMRMPS